MDWSSSPTTQTFWWTAASSRISSYWLRLVSWYSSIIRYSKRLFQLSRTVSSCCEQAHGLEQQVVEIQGVGLPQAALVFLVDQGQPGDFGSVADL